MATTSDTNDTGLGREAIAAVGVLKVPEHARPEMLSAIGPTILGGLITGLDAYIPVPFLTR